MSGASLIYGLQSYRHRSKYKEMRMNIRPFICSAILLGLGGCSGMYYGTMESLGVHKRDILVDRVKEARDTQNETKQQFLTTMEQFKSVVNFQGGDLEKQYDKLNATLQKCESKADEVRKRIRSVESVSDALFKEWNAELKKYNNETLRNLSQKKYDLAKSKYTDLIASMKRAESKLEPTLIPLRDQVLYIKHNLNAKAIAGLSDELVGVQTTVDDLVRDIESAIAEADSFIASLQTE